MTRYTLWTVVFLILLRLAIGWHFFFEGWHKVHSVYVGPTVTNKPFSSEAYFREAEGPLGDVVREQIGDPDEEALAKLTVRPLGPDEDPTKVPPHTRMPTALAAEWDAYLKRFTDYYKLDDRQKLEAENRLKQAEDEVVRWLTKGTKEVKKSYPSGVVDVKQTTADRIQDYRLKLAEIRDALDRRLPALGRDVEKAHLRTLKGEATAMRTDLLGDLNKYTESMKKSLADMLQMQLSGFRLDAPTADDTLLAMLTPGGGSEGTEEDIAKKMPSELATQWDAYAAFVKNFGRDGEGKGPLGAEQQAQIDQQLQRAKVRYVRWLSDRDEYLGSPLPEPVVGPKIEAYRKAVEKARPATAAALMASAAPEAMVFAPVARDRDYFRDEIGKQTAVMKTNLGTTLTADQTQGFVPPEKASKRIDRMDWVARWFLLVVGGLLLLGLFSRTACILGAGFLLTTYLLHPAFPWLPTSPKDEGYYLFVNKNAIEMLALLALAGTASGRWFGLDGLVSYVFGGRRRRKAREAAKQDAKKVPAKV